MNKQFFHIFAVMALGLSALHLISYNIGYFHYNEHIMALVQFMRSLSLDSNLFLNKMLIITMLVLSGQASTVIRKIKLGRVAILLVGSIICFLSLHIMFSEGWAYIILFCLLFTSTYFLSCAIGTYVSYGDVQNRNNKPVEVDFMQETKQKTNEYSVNIQTRFTFQGRQYNGWLNIVNPFRGSMAVGLPGSGKTYTFFYHYIEQMISKGYCGFCYDFKFDELSEIVYNILLKNANKYPVTPKFYVINLDDPHKSNRCNPLNPAFLTDIIDAYEAAYMVMINLNKSWVKKQGDFFIESAIVFFTAIIWYLKQHKDGAYCTLPHAIELLMRPYEAVFSMLQENQDVRNYMSPFINAMEGGAQEQLQGQIASGQIPLARLSSPTIYWALSGDDFTLDINNPAEPKIVCLGNNPDRQNIYAAALSLYISRMFKVINRPKRQKCFVMLDELPTIYIRGLDNLIATARSNKVAIVAGAQDYSQITRDYGQVEADVIVNTIGNIFAGQVKGKTAKSLSETFGKINKQKRGITYHEKDSSNNVNLNTQLEEMIPSSIISTLSQGTFVGQVADNYEQKIQQKFFHAEVLPNEFVEKNINSFVPIPQLASSETGDLNEIVKGNYERIKEEVDNIISPYI